MMKGLTAGRIVHYVLPSGRSMGEHRPAMVVRVWESPPQEPYRIQLVVFQDGTNDVSDGALTRWATSVPYDEDEKLPGTWHWIEQA